MRRSLPLLLCVVLTGMFSLSAKAGVVTGPDTLQTYDSGCTNVDSGTSGCFAYGADGANGGTAGGMTACTAWKFCVSCERPLGAAESICVEAHRNASCKCSGGAGTGKVCAGSGACTYKGPAWN